MIEWICFPGWIPWWSWAMQKTAALPRTAKCGSWSKSPVFAKRTWALWNSIKLIKSSHVLKMPALSRFITETWVACVSQLHHCASAIACRHLLSVLMLVSYLYSTQSVVINLSFHIYLSQEKPKGHEALQVPNNTEPNSNTEPTIPTQSEEVIGQLVVW